MTREHVVVFGASRTDAGVHAYDQAASFHTEKDIAPAGWAAGLNTHLPRDVAVTRAASCEPTYNPRFDADHKTYRYLIRTGDVKDPLTRFRAWQVGRSRAHPERRREKGDLPTDWLDLDEMKQAAQKLVGTHSFHAFRASSDERESTERTMKSLSVETGFGGDEHLVAIHVCGNAFLKNMVRIMAGTLLDVGRGRMTADDVGNLLLPEATRQTAGETAPPHGLYLVNIALRANV